MSERIQQSIDTREANVRNFVNEIRTYYSFHETDPHLPFEVYITELPLNHTQPWHSHNTVEETIIPISGRVNIFIKGQDGKVERTQLPESTMFDLERESIVGISVVEDGTVTIRVQDKETGEIRSFDIQDNEGFYAGTKIHTLQNYSDQEVVVAVVKKTTKVELARNPNIFRGDRDSH